MTDTTTSTLATKKPWQSKALWGSLISIAACTGDWITTYFPSWEYSTQVDIALKSIALMGALIAFYGRWVAQAKITTD